MPRYTITRDITETAFIEAEDLSQALEIGTDLAIDEMFRQVNDVVVEEDTSTETFDSLSFAEEN